MGPLRIKSDLLFWIVRRICEDPRVKATLDSITAADHNSVLACFYKFVIKQNIPLRMEEFPMAVRHKVSAGAFATELSRCKILEAIRKLEFNACVGMKIQENVKARTWLKYAT